MSFLFNLRQNFVDQLSQRLYVFVLGQAGQEIFASLLGYLFFFIRNHILRNIRAKGVSACQFLPNQLAVAGQKPVEVNLGRVGMGIVFECDDVTGARGDGVALFFASNNQ